MHHFSTGNYMGFHVRLGEGKTPNPKLEHSSDAYIYIHTYIPYIIQCQNIICGIR